MKSIELPQLEEQHTERQSNRFRFDRRSLGLIFAIWLIAMVLVVPTVVPHSIDVRLGSPSPESVLAPRKLEDRYTTSALKQEAMDKVPLSMFDDPKVSAQVQSELNVLLDQVAQIQDKFTDPLARVVEITKKVPASWDLSEHTLQGLAVLDKQRAEAMRQVLITIVQERYKESIDKTNRKAHQLLAQEELLLKLPDDPVARDLLDQLIQINYVVNENVTEIARKIAADEVETKWVLQGERILAMGDIVTEREYMLLEDLGMLSASLNWEPILAVSGGLLCLVALLLAVVVLLTPQMMQEPRKIAVLGLLVVLTLLLGRTVLYGLPGQAVLIPVPTMTLIVAVLFDLPLALAFGTILSMMCGFLLGGDAVTLQVFLIGSIAAIFGSRNLRQRTDLLFIGFRIGLTQAVFLFLNDVLRTGFQINIWMNAAWGLLSGLLSGFLALGMLPFLEGAFHLISSLKLLELGNPNHPLLRKLLMEAPGSYQHSIMVANLAEIVCDEIGADSLLARVGATFHDVGKSKRPIYFIENHIQKENPHDQLRPLVSASILFAHVTDGIELGREYKLPEQVLQFVRSHHGTTEAAFFYRKAQQEAPEGVSIDVSDYRYPGPKPPNREVAIVMLADTCEAAVRSLKEPSAENIATTVERICQERLNSGQLDDCDLTIRDLNRAMQTLVKALTSVYHRRIQYPPETRVETALKDVPKEIAPKKEEEATTS